jgi:3-dehydroquinate dehydratase-2
VRIAVLNGVNLDVLDRRDAVHYGGLTLADLESRIYAWSKEFTCTTRCRQTNHEGQFVDWCHDALDWADGVILNPGAWSHYSYAIRDAVELFKGAGRRGASFQHRGAGGVAARLGDQRPGDEARLR